jgi:peptide/nickel transport system permease protein
MKGPLSISTVVAILLLLGILVLVAVVPFLPGYDPYTQDLAASLLPPGGRDTTGDVRLLGTDALGRDMMSRLSLAGRLSLFIGVVAVLASMVIGVGLGLVAGFFRGWAENVIMGIADLQLSIPRVLLLIAVTAIIGQSVTHLALLLGITSWVAYGRVARAMALSLREREFVLSATTQGASAAWNIRKHLLPNVMPQMLIVGSYELGQVIVLESALSYLGLGVQPPLPSWGLMVSEGQTYLELDPWLSVLPSIALFMLVAGVQFLSQAFTAENDTSAEAARMKS